MASASWRLRLLLVAASAAAIVSCQRSSPVSAGRRNRTSSAEGSFSDTEHAFLKIPDAASARRNLRFITSEPHVAGTEGDWKMARFVANEFSSSGIPDVSIFELKAALNYPRTAPQVRLLSTIEKNDNGGPKILFNASLTENIEDSDETSDTFWRNHTFHGYSPSGDVTAPLVFANYGRPQDFAALETAGVTVKDTIVLMRYGQCFRGLKVMNAQTRGALGVIIYSDPADDGFGQGDVYPNGPWRPETGVQRGSVQFISTCAGDPLRIDERYERHALQNRCGVSNYTALIPSVPSLPMSYGDAKPFLQHLEGPSALDVFGEDFDGGLNISYTVGPSGASVVRMIIDNEKTIGSIPNVIGYIPGALAGTKADMPILLGNHRDAWYVFGMVEED
jgi:N-acetylated-alpha-linked acidic dipeptidase